MKKQATYHKEKRMVTCQRLLDTNETGRFVEKEHVLWYSTGGGVYFLNILEDGCER